MEIITSSKNEKIKNITALLSTKKERDKQGLFVIEGLRIFQDTLKTAPSYIKDIFVSESFLKEHPETEILSGTDEKEVKLYPVKDSIFDSISGTVTPQGILCTVKKPGHSLEEILTDAKKLLVLENIQDPGNLGTMLRTAEAAGVSGIVLSHGFGIQGSVCICSVLCRSSSQYKGTGYHGICRVSSRRRISFRCTV